MELWGMYGSGCVRRLFRGTSFSDIHGGWLAAGGERLLFMKTDARHLWAMKTWSFNVVAEAIGDKNTILVGECKWKSADYADRLLAKLKAKTEKAPFSQGKNIVYVLFLKEHPLSEADCCILYPDDVLKYQPE